MALPPIECDAPECKNRIAFYNAQRRRGVCLHHGTEACACGTPIEQCWLTGCGEWQVTDPQLEKALQDSFTDVDDEIVH